MTILDHPSPNRDSRDGNAVSMLVLHYTGMESGEAAIARLCDPAAKVSSHYVVEEDGRIFALVPEAMRAWHAGVSYWRGLRNLNGISVGIEIVNPGHEFGYRAFPDAQMQSVINLSRDIVQRHGIAPEMVVGHSDIAPLRKIDPGELFDWEALAREGIGMPIPVSDRSMYDGQLSIGASGDAVRVLQQYLGLLGYDIPATGHYDTHTDIVVSAFQRRFRRSLVSGIADANSCDVLRMLVARHGMKDFA